MSHTETIDVNAYLDGELGPDEAAEIEARLDSDPEVRARLDAFARQKDHLGEALSELASSGPRNLKTARLEKRLAAALHHRAAPRRSFAAGPWMRGGAQIAAACALVAFGWWGHASWSPPSSGVPDYVSEAVGAHRIFAEDIVQPAEFTGAAIESATEWFSTKIGTQVNAPDLGEFDMALIGARLLGTKEGPMAQFIYEDAAGDRYSLTLARHPEDRPLAPLQVVDYPERAAGYWSTPNIDFTLVGKKSGTSVQNVAATLAGHI